MRVRSGPGQGHADRSSRDGKQTHAKGPGRSRRVEIHGERGGGPACARARTISAGRLSLVGATMFHPTPSGAATAGSPASITAAAAAARAPFPSAISAPFPVTFPEEAFPA